MKLTGLKTRLRVVVARCRTERPPPSARENPLLAALCAQLIDLCADGFQVLETHIDDGVADVGDLVQFVEFLNGNVADQPAGYLGPARLADREGRHRGRALRVVTDLDSRLRGNDGREWSAISVTDLDS